MEYKLQRANQMQMNETLTEVIIHKYFEYLPLLDQLNFMGVNKQIYHVSRNIKHLSLLEHLGENLENYDDLTQAHILHHGLININAYKHLVNIESYIGTCPEYMWNSTKDFMQSKKLQLVSFQEFAGTYIRFTYATFGAGPIQIHAHLYRDSEFDLDITVTVSEPLAPMLEVNKHYTLLDNNVMRKEIITTIIQNIFGTYKEEHVHTMLSFIQEIMAPEHFPREFVEYSILDSNEILPIDEQSNSYVASCWFDSVCEYSPHIWTDITLLERLETKLLYKINNSQFMRSEILEWVNIDEMDREVNGDLGKLLDNVENVRGSALRLTMGFQDYPPPIINSSFELHLPDRVVVVEYSEINETATLLCDGKKIIQAESIEHDDFEELNYIRQIASELEVHYAMLLVFLLSAANTVYACNLNKYDHSFFASPSDGADTYGEHLINSVIETLYDEEEDYMLGYISGEKELNDRERRYQFDAIDVYSAFDDPSDDEGNESIDDEYVDREQNILDYLYDKEQLLKEKKHRWDSFQAEDEVKKELTSKLFDHVSYMSVEIERRDYLRIFSGSVRYDNNKFLDLCSNIGDSEFIFDLTFDDEILMKISNQTKVKQDVLARVRNKIGVTEKVSDETLITAILDLLPFEETIYRGKVVIN
jgi:hypothetical protein